MLYIISALILLLTLMIICPILIATAMGLWNMIKDLTDDFQFKKVSFADIYFLIMGVIVFLIVLLGLIYLCSSIKWPL